jgi:hypothetical protein
MLPDLGKTLPRFFLTMAPTHAAGSGHDGTRLGVIRADVTTRHTMPIETGFKNVFTPAHR